MKIKKSFKITIVTILAFLLCNGVINAKTPKVTCTYISDAGDLQPLELKSVLVVKRYSSGKNTWTTKNWSATLKYGTTNPDKQGASWNDIESADRWHGTWGAFSDDFVCPKYAAWAIRKYDCLYCGTLYVHYANSYEELEENGPKDLDGYGVTIVMEESYKQAEKEAEEKICDGRDLVNGIGTDREGGLNSEGVFLGLKYWYEKMDEMDNNNCFDYDTTNDTWEQFNEFENSCNTLYSLFAGSEYTTYVAVENIFDAVDYMKELGCVKDTDVIYNGDTLAQSVAKINDYRQRAIDNEWKLHSKYQDLVDDYECQINGNCPSDDEEDDKYTGPYYCGLFGENSWPYIKNLYKLVKIIIPALIIVLGMIDFMKVLFSGEEKDMKASGTKFLKRIIAGVVFILLPVLLEFLIGLFGFSENCLQEFIK